MRFVATVACAVGVLVLAGCAGTSLSVQQSFAPAASGAVLGVFSVESKNPGSWRTSRVLLEEHADCIAAYLRSRS